MFKKFAILGLSALAGTYAYIKIKEKRSIQSIIREQLIRSSHMKDTFLTQTAAKQAVEDMASETYGDYKGTNYSFKHDIIIERENNTTVYTVNDKQDSRQRTILYAHGGAWFQHPMEMHFEFIDGLASELDAKVVMPIYPKIPHQDYRATFELFEKLYRELLNKVESSQQLVVMGDSAGGQIALAFAQMLKEKDLPQPQHIVLVSPVLDATFSHPEATKYEAHDPMLGVEGSRYLVAQWAGDTPLEDYKLSPINGDLEGLGHITVTVGTNEILYPDALNLSQLLNAKGITHDFIPGYRLFHIYPVFRLPERRRFLKQLSGIIS